MTVMRRWLLNLALLLPAIGLVALAVPRLVAGAALEGCFLAGLQIMANVPLSSQSYQQTADILSHVTPEDGETQLLRAEAALDAGAPPPSLISPVGSALSRAPASARGWIILASLLRPLDPKAAARDLSLAFELAPIDYYQILPRTFVGASLWDGLPVAVRAKLLIDARRLAIDRDRRDDLRILLTKPGGAELVTRALSAQPEVLRNLNRDLAHDALHF